MKKLLIASILSLVTNGYAEIRSGNNLPEIPASLKAGSCFNSEMIAESLPCPGGEIVKALDTRYQTAGIFLSFIQEENEKYLSEMLQTLNAISYRGVVNLLIEPESKESYLKFIAKHRGDLTINTHAYSDVTRVSVFKWLQDGLQFAYKDGKPAVIAINSVHEFSRAYDIAADDEEMFSSVLNNVHDRFAGQLAASCDIELIYKEDTLTAESRDWSSGGNFTPLPGNQWALAANIYDYDEYPSRQETLYPDVYFMYSGDFPYVSDFFEPAQLAFIDTVGMGRNAIDVPTAYFGIGHIDESISLIPLAEKEEGLCDFGVLYADALAAHGILNVVAEDEFEGEMLVEKNDFLSSSVHKFTATLEQKLGCKIKVVSAPIATDIAMTDYLAGNQLNGLVIRDGEKTSFLTSSVESKELGKAFEKSLRKLNSKINYLPVDASLYNGGTGGVHCATASIRVCK